MNAPTDSGAPSKSRPIPETRAELSPSRKKRLKEIDVSTLFGEAREISLLHRGEVYSLRITANSKLILTK